MDHRLQQIHNNLSKKIPHKKAYVSIPKFSSLIFFLQPSLTQNANIRTLINDPSYNLVRIKQPPEHINDKIAFTFNNLSFSNLSQKAQELKEVLNNDEQLWKWVGQYLVIKRVSLEHNFHSLYAGFLQTLNITILFDTVLTETHRNIKVRTKHLHFLRNDEFFFFRRFFY